MDSHEIDSMVYSWRERMMPVSPQMRRAQMDDAWFLTTSEMMRRYAHMYDQAMRLEDVSEETRRRVLSMVLLGSPDGLESMRLAQVEHLLKDAIMQVPPRPIYFNPYSFPFHPDEPLDDVSMGRD